MTSLFGDKQLLVNVPSVVKKKIQFLVSLTLEMISVPKSVYVCLFTWARFINMQPLFPLKCNQYGLVHGSLYGNIATVLLSQTKPMTHFDVETHWQRSLGTKRGGRRQIGVYCHPFSQGQVSSRGASEVVIHWDVRAWLPPGWKCNMTDYSGGGRREC